jgi:hypothetical protein
VIAFAVAASGRVAALGDGGRTLSLERAGPSRSIDLPFEAVRCRFRGEDLVVLGKGGELLSLSAEGQVRGTVRVREDACDLAVLPGGSVLVSYGRRGAEAHGVTLERFGDAPAAFRDPARLDRTRLAPAPGGVWLLGVAVEEPLARAVLLRPVPEGFLARETVALPGPARSAATGPDGALFVLLEPGTFVVRVDKGRAGEPVLLPGPLHDLAREGHRLLGCGAHGVEDLTRLVPPPPPERPPPDLPPCSA